MDKTKYLIVGAGISGLSFADWVRDEDYLIIEALHEVGGYCRTIHQDGFVWDFSGHFFHFRRPDIEEYLVSRMGDQRVLKVAKNSRIFFEDRMIDFPFQKNIHQLPQADFIDCLYDLYFKEDVEPSNFREMLYTKFGRSIAEKFLVPYNEKLYATGLDQLDVDAMGRFFPYADIKEIIGNFRRPDNESYNSTFTYPEGGAIQYVGAIQQGVNDEKICLSERVVSIDLERRIAKTDRREVKYEHLISSAPFDKLLGMCGLEASPEVYSYNKVLVFNLGFDAKGLKDTHWVYYPQRDLCFYRVGYYDNIFDTDRMSIYVEVGCGRDFQLQDGDTEMWRERVLTDLKRAGVITEQKLVSHHSILLDPAYVHITKESIKEVSDRKAQLAEGGVHSIGRYGSWTYCSIEDNIIEARALAEQLDGR